MLNIGKINPVYIQLFKAIGIIILVYVVLSSLFIPFISSEEFQTFIQSIGIWGYIIVILLFVISHVFAPIPGSPILLIGIGIYGFHAGLILLFIAGLISATICFYISRRYGRKWVIKLVGKSSMDQVDKFISIEGTKSVIITRLFGFSFFDFISYAFGLTKISFKTYFIVTFICTLIVNIFYHIIFRNVDMESALGLTIFIAFIFISGITFGLLFNSYHKKLKR